MERPRVALIIPALNEAATIGAVIDGLAPHGVVIVVDDGSTDATPEVAERHGAVVVSHSVNAGYDAALESGFARAAVLGVEFVVTVDADGQHPPELVSTYIEALSAGADLVLGVRPSLPRVSERLFAWITRWRYEIQDPLCGMKGYRVALYGALGWFDSYRSIGTELMLHAVRGGAKVVTVPVAVRPRADRPRFGIAVYANARILRAAALGLTRN